MHSHPKFVSYFTTLESYIVEDYINDVRMNYFKSCLDCHSIVLPLLSKVRNKCLNLTGYTLNSNLAQAFMGSLKKGETVIIRLVLQNNSIHDSDFASILNGL